MNTLQGNLESVTGELKGNRTIADRFRTEVAQMSISMARRTDPHDWLARMAFEPRRDYRKAA
jgi:hypothetical protein